MNKDSARGPSIQPDPFVNRSRGLNAIHVRHDQIHQHDIGFFLQGQFNGFTAILGLSDDFDIVMQCEQRCYSASDDRVVVGKQYAHSTSPVTDKALKRIIDTRQFFVPSIKDRLARRVHP